MIERGDINFLQQLVETLEEAEKRLEFFYATKDVSNFNKAKKLIIQIQRRIAGVIG